jgi:predicted murein hydrolase (TIGR00659 family)
MNVPPPFAEIWVYLAATPLLGLTITLLAYQAAHSFYTWLGGNPLANPVAVAVILIIALLSLSGTPYATYFDGAKFVHFLLGPATVALAVPLHGQLPRLKRMFGPLLLALLAGSLTAIGSAMALGSWLGASRQTVLSLAPKSVTTPIAMGVAEKIGGLPSLTAVLVVTTGVLGAIMVRGLLRLLRIDENDHAVLGFSVGVAAHGIGTARAFQISETAGAFAALAMGLNGLLTALLLPQFV